MNGKKATVEVHSARMPMSNIGVYFVWIAMYNVIWMEKIYFFFAEINRAVRKTIYLGCALDVINNILAKL